MSKLIHFGAIYFNLLLFGSQLCWSLVRTRQYASKVNNWRREFFMKVSNDWDDDVTQSISISQASLPALDSASLNKLEHDLNSIVSISAINTVSYYMLEFRDDVYEGWMKSFANYSKNGFPNGRWEEYIESMIQQDMQSFQVTTRPPKALLRGRNSKLGGNVVLVYDVELEPRKIAHQILTVREHVCEEMISDLYCVQSEHDEVIRYASVKMKDGEVAAEKSRRKPRDPSESSTPNRNRNYFNLDALLTGMALTSMQLELKNRKDILALDILDQVVGEIQRRHMAKDVATKFFSEMFGPRALLEELYFKGITDGVQLVDGKSVNILTLAQSLMGRRLAFSLEAQKLLRYQNLNNRQYYKMIKDLGGFKKLDLKSAKMRILDLDAEKRQQEESAAAATSPNTEMSKGGVPDPSTTGLLGDAIAADDTRETASPASSVVESTEENVEEGNLFGTDFGTAGPVVMM